jgi:phosphopantetheine--protein transferase-like protein
LPHVGNDVVDLKEQANRYKSRDLRYLKKILTDAEIEFVTKAKNTDVALWSFWACKEAAYKVMKKSFPDSAFTPRLWQVTYAKSRLEYSEGEVEIPQTGSVFVHLISNADYVHCVGANGLEILDKLISGVEVLPEEETNPSFFLRQCLAERLAARFALNFHQIQIRRTMQNNELQPPRVYIDSKTTDIDISLSHDGRFVAYAIGC